MGWLYRYLFLDFWVPVWPNLAAAAIGALWVDSRVKVRQLAHHEELKKHVTLEVHKAAGTEGSTNDTVPG